MGHPEPHCQQTLRTQRQLRPHTPRNSSLAEPILPSGAQKLPRQPSVGRRMLAGEAEKSSTTPALLRCRCKLVRDGAP